MYWVWQIKYLLLEIVRISETVLAIYQKFSQFIRNGPSHIICEFLQDNYFESKSYSNSNPKTCFNMGFYASYVHNTPQTICSSVPTHSQTVSK